MLPSTTNSYPAHPMDRELPPEGWDNKQFVRSSFYSEWDETRISVMFLMSPARHDPEGLADATMGLKGMLRNPGKFVSACMVPNAVNDYTAEFILDARLERPSYHPSYHPSPKQRQQITRYIRFAVVRVGTHIMREEVLAFIDQLQNEWQVEPLDGLRFMIPTNTGHGQSREVRLQNFTNSLQQVQRTRDWGFDDDDDDDDDDDANVGQGEEGA